MGLTIIFAGTPEVAVPTLRQLVASSHRVVAVYTQPDRKAGRGRQLQPSPVKVQALEYQLPIEQPRSFHDEAACQHLASYSADLMVVVAYGLLLPQAVLSAPRLGCVNVHFSLLPLWRGAAPIQYALLNGDQETGVSVMQMTLGLDAGDIIAVAKTPILADDNRETLSDRLAEMGATLLSDSLADIASGSIDARAQPASLVSYAHKIQKQDAALAWQDSARVLERKVRAYYGWPVAFADVQQRVLRIWKASAVSGSFKQAPGTLICVDKKPLIVCGQGALQLQEVQLPGKRRMSGRDFLNTQAEQKAC